MNCQLCAEKKIELVHAELLILHVNDRNTKIILKSRLSFTHASKCDNLNILLSHNSLKLKFKNTNS